MGTFHTQDSIHILEQHNNSFSQTRQCNRISSLFSHRTNSKVLLLPFIHYHIVSNSSSAVFNNIYFSVVFDIQPRLLSISYTSALREVWLPTPKLLDPSPGAPPVAREHSITLMPRQRIRPHTVTGVQEEHNNQCNP